MVDVMEKKFEFLNIGVSRERNFYLLKNKLSNEFFEVVLYATILILLPLVFHVQIVTGILVNAILVKAALDYNMKRVAVLSVLPSVSALAGGFLFGDMTYAFLLMLPFIWVGNFLFALGVKEIFVKRKVNYLLATISSAAGKTILLFTSAFVLFSYSLVPELFLTAFGVLQLVTALVGAILTGLLRMKKLI